MTDEQRQAFYERMRWHQRGTDERRLKTNARKKQLTRGTQELHLAFRARQKQYKNGTEERRLKTARVERMYLRNRNGTSTNHGRNLYVLKSDSFPGIFKVGRANDPSHRARGVEAGNFFRLHVILDYKGMGIRESEVHDALRAFRYNPENKLRTEWFKLPEEQLVAIVRDIVSRYEH